MPDQTEKGKSLNKDRALVLPTLFIGIGGTGMEICLRVRRRLLNHIWGKTNPRRISNLTEFPLAQFINFDLSQVSVTESGKSKATDPLADLVKFKDDEKLILPIDTDKYFSTEGQLDRYEHIASWFPLTRKKILELGIDLKYGAGQIRALSRLYFFDKYKTLERMIDNKISSLLAGVTNDDKIRNLELRHQSGSLRVVVIASTAGGTGSGSFLDMGYLATKRVGTKKNLKSAVDLCLMLPSGYAGHGKVRTEANTYAALMELESCMGGNGLNFVERWQKDEDLVLPLKPYNEVFLFDTGNLANQKTLNATDLFDMVADILFEDFISEDFANWKRQIAPNQEQYKSGSFSVSAGQGKYGNMQMKYSKAYSAFGQSIIDTHLEQRRDEIACGQVNNMLKVFFGIASDFGKGGAVPPPSPDDGRSLLVKHVCGEKENFKIIYKFASAKKALPYKEGLEYPMYRLLDNLLYDGDKSMVGHIHNLINKAIDEIRARTDSDQRMPEVEKFRSEIDRNLGIEASPTDTGARGIEDNIKARRKVVFQNMVAENSNLLSALWQAVDNKDRGGLNYTIKLIERMKDCIENRTTGLLYELENAEKWFFGLWEKLRVEDLTILQKDIASTKRKDYAEDILTNIGVNICSYAEARLRELACREAATLLKEISAWLGHHDGIDSQGRKNWTVNSFAGRLAGHEKVVVEIMAGMDKEAIRIREASKQGHAAYQIVKTFMPKLDAADKLDPKKAMEWATEVFQNIGKSRALFQMLEKDEGRAELVTKLRFHALSRLPKTETGLNDPLIKALIEMDKPNTTELMELFQTCMRMAMPWVEANPGGEWSVDPDQYSYVIGVEENELFETNFGSRLKSSIPPHTGWTPQELKFYKTGLPGKLTCYVELSGMPLHALNLLETWRNSYKEEENKKIPLHTHKDKTRFVHPMAPSPEALGRLAEHFKLYIQGIALGVLKLRIEDLNERLYCYIHEGIELSIGDERTIRMDGIASGLKELHMQVNHARDRIKTPAQLDGLALLYEFYSKKVYPPVVTKIGEGKSEKAVAGFANVICANLGEEVREALKNKSSLMGFETAEGIKHMKDVDEDKKWERLYLLTDQIEGSETDVYEHEVRKTHVAKRALKREFFQEGWLEKNIFNRGVEFAMPNEPQGFRSYKVAIDGKSKGPFDWRELYDLVQKGQLTSSTKVWRKPMTQWQTAGEIDELSPLLENSEPPLIDDGEPPLT